MANLRCKLLSNVTVSSCLSTFRYEIMNFQRLESGVYDYINIGSWHEGVLSLDDDTMQINRSELVRSVCSEPCSKGEIKVRRQHPITTLLPHTFTMQYLNTVLYMQSLQWS